MKRILVCSHWMEIGGAERALLGLLKSFDYSKVNVDLYLCRHSGEFMKLIPEEVNLLPEDKNAAAIAISAKEALKKGCFKILFGRVCGKIKTFFYLKKHHINAVNNIAIEYSNKYTYKYVKKINPDVIYDLAISFLEPHYITAYKVNAKKKIAWMHTDYKAIHIDKIEGLRIWKKFDRIAAISDDCYSHFVDIFPQLKNKIFLVENIIDESLILTQAKEKLAVKEMAEKCEVKLLSVGRFCEAKNFDNIPNICKRIIECGIDVCWYIIGYGKQEIIEKQIIDEGMEGRVIILGKKDNPYPYINKCDLYVQPSRYEGKCVTVREAQILAKPVVITNYATAQSQLENGIDGVIVPQDNEGCAQGIIELLRNTSKMEKLVKNCQERDYTNKDEISKIYSYLE